MKILKFFVIVSFFFAWAKLFAQCDSIADICEKHFTPLYISDGQQYRALLISDEVAEFKVTFFGGTTYRISGCSGLSDGNLIFSLYDTQNNLLFVNSDYNNAPYWDFNFKSTIDCRIEAKLDAHKLSSGCAVMLIGFKQ